MLLVLDWFEMELYLLTQCARCKLCISTGRGETRVQGRRTCRRFMTDKVYAYDARCDDVGLMWRMAGGTRRFE